MGLVHASTRRERQGQRVLMLTVIHPSRAEARAMLAVKVPCPLCTSWHGAGSKVGVAAALAGHLATAHHIATPPNTPTVAIGQARTTGPHLDTT